MKHLSKITAPIISGMKQTGEKIVCLTAYDTTSALISDQAGVELILVGDSLGTVIHGSHTTTLVTLEDILYHTRWVARAVKRALVVSDLPFGSYGSALHRRSITRFNSFDLVQKLSSWRAYS